jgi:hypothetical protein
MPLCSFTNAQSNSCQASSPGSFEKEGRDEEDTWTLVGSFVDVAVNLGVEFRTVVGGSGKQTGSWHAVKRQCRL